MPVFLHCHLVVRQTCHWAMIGLAIDFDLCWSYTSIRAGVDFIHNHYYRLCRAVFMEQISRFHMPPKWGATGGLNLNMIWWLARTSHSWGSMAEVSFSSLSAPRKFAPLSDRISDWVPQQARKHLRTSSIDLNAVDQIQMYAHSC